MSELIQTAKQFADRYKRPVGIELDSRGKLTLTLTPSAKSIVTFNGPKTHDVYASMDQYAENASISIF